ncbi:hypothetical protein [Tsukamurella sp. USMM236]|uniref:hypothetical protein n=1 Tax=Tsukamurella sp. USMM236 TaxID=3081301 RepID=UPI00301A187B
MEGDVVFSPGEQADLRAHGIVLFEGRVIFDARPPMTDRELEVVQSVCAGPLPDGLRALWRTTAGGRLDYDLPLTMAGNAESFAWSELFYNGSDGYYDLQGWIDHELEITYEVTEAQQSGTLLDFLPFGGSNYYARVYAIVAPDHPARGGVIAWQEALPPAWRHRLHEDAVATVASTVEAAFAALHLAEDPLAPVDEFFTGQALLEYVDERHVEHGLAADLAHRVIAFYRRALLDWRTPLAEGTLPQRPVLARTALRHAVATDDTDLVTSLVDAGVSLAGPLHGSALAIDVALGSGAFSAAKALALAGAPVAADALVNVDQAIDPESVRTLLDRGAGADVRTMARLVACGALESARLIGRACGIDEDHHVRRAFDEARAALLDELETALSRATDPTSGYAHYLGVEGLSLRVNELRRCEL